MKFVVVYDSGCGGCSDLAAALAAVLEPVVLVRSCRDPALAAELPVLGEHLSGNPCRRPLTVTVPETGEARVASGLGMVIGAARLVKPGRRLAAGRLAARFLLLRLTTRSSHRLPRR